MDRRSGVVLALSQFSFPMTLSLTNRVNARARIVCLAWQCAKSLRQFRECRFGVAHDADVDRIDLADLGRVDVDLNKARRRNRKRVLRIPRAAVGLGE